MSKTIIGIVIGLLVVGGVVFYFQSQPVQAPTGNTTLPPPTNDAMMKKDEMMKEYAPITVELHSQNKSGEKGTATLTNLGGGQTKVAIKLTGAPATTPQPAHIHSGSCATLGGVVYPLADVVSGVSEKVLDVSIDMLKSQLPLAINVHKSQTEATVYVACGDLTASSMRDTDDAMMDKGGAMMDTNGSMMERGVTVEITSSGFSPQTATVKAGTKVTWINKTTSLSWPATAIHPTHTIYPGSDINKCGTSDATKIFDTCHELKPGESYSFVFSEKGTWAYHDHVHSGRFGKIVVE